MATAVEYLREHVPDKTRIHYVISNGGQASNVVPCFAEIDLIVRHDSPQVAHDVWKRIVEIARGAAITTETVTEYELTSGCYPLLINRTLINVAADNFNTLSLPQWNKNQMEFAKGIASTRQSRQAVRLYAYNISLSFIGYGNNINKWKSGSCNRGCNGYRPDPHGSH